MHLGLYTSEHTFMQISMSVTMWTAAPKSVTIFLEAITAHAIADTNSPVMEGHVKVCGRDF